MGEVIVIRENYNVILARIKSFFFKMKKEILDFNKWILVLHVLEFKLCCTQSFFFWCKIYGMFARIVLKYCCQGWNKCLCNEISIVNTYMVKSALYILYILLLTLIVFCAHITHLRTFFCPKNNY
jgi:hypothetical protein